MEIETKKLYDMIAEEVENVLVEVVPAVHRSLRGSRSKYKRPEGYEACPAGTKYRDYGTAGGAGCWKYEKGADAGWELITKHDSKGLLRTLMPDEPRWVRSGYGIDQHRRDWRPHGTSYRSGEYKGKKIKRPIITRPMKSGAIRNSDGEIISFLNVDPAVLKQKKNYVTPAMYDYLMGMYRRVPGIHDMEDTGYQSGGDRRHKGHHFGHATHLLGRAVDIPLPIIYTDPKTGERVSGYNFVSFGPKGSRVYPGDPGFRDQVYTGNMRMLKVYERKPNGEYVRSSRLKKINGELDTARLHKILAYSAEKKVDFIYLGPELVRRAKAYSKKLASGPGATEYDKEIHKSLFVGPNRIVKADTKKLSHGNHAHIRSEDFNAPLDQDYTVDYKDGKLVPTTKKNPFGKTIDLGGIVFHKDPSDPKTADPGGTEYYSSEEELDKEYPEFAKPPKYKKPKRYNPELEDPDLPESRKLKVSNLADIIREEIQNYLMGDMTYEELEATLR